MKSVRNTPEYHLDKIPVKSNRWLDWATLINAYWFEKHCDVVCRRNCVRYYPFKPFNWILSLTSFSHEVRTHATWHSWVFQSSFGHHGLNREWYSREIEVTTNNLLADEFDHFFACGTYFLNLYFVCTNLPSFGICMLMSMFVLVWEKTVLKLTDSREVISFCVSYGEGEIHPS